MRDRTQLALLIISVHQNDEYANHAIYRSLGHIVEFGLIELVDRQQKIHGAVNSYDKIVHLNLL